MASTRSTLQGWTEHIGAHPEHANARIIPKREGDKSFPAVKLISIRSRALSSDLAKLGPSYLGLTSKMRSTTYLFRVLGYRRQGEFPVVRGTLARIRIVCNASKPKPEPRKKILDTERVDRCRQLPGTIQPMLRLCAALPLDILLKIRVTIRRISVSALQ